MEDETVSKKTNTKSRLKEMAWALAGFGATIVAGVAIYKTLEGKDVASVGEYTDELGQEVTMIFLKNGRNLMFKRPEDVSS